MRVKTYTLLSFILFFPLFSVANTDVLTQTWRATYYNAIPNKAGVSKQYCEEHSPGTFVGNVTEQLKHGALTDKGIHLDHFSFHEEIKHGVYLLHGTALAHGTSHQKQWQDKIHYYLYKLEPLGTTKGIWTTNHCKGLYLGTLAQHKQVVG